VEKTKILKRRLQHRRPADILRRRERSSTGRDVLFISRFTSVRVILKPRFRVHYDTVN